jgi:hypothetical protein
MKCENCKYCVNRKHEIDPKRVNVCVKNGSVNVISNQSGCNDYQKKG